ncbi:MAG: SEL1-like repeat protein [Planctomycetes bacterium]|nr:SEL1-like repeat protein [Planctomycetota bacterium]
MKRLIIGGDTMVFFLMIAVAGEPDYSDLSPAIQARQYLKDIQAAMQRSDNREVVALCEKILALPDLDMGPDFTFYYARSLKEIERNDEAYRHIMIFLNSPDHDPDLVDEALEIRAATVGSVKAAEKLIEARGILEPVLIEETMVGTNHRLDGERVNTYIGEITNAIAILREAADMTGASRQTSAEIALLLGECYSLGPFEDKSESILWFKKAAELGDPCAQWSLGERLSKEDDDKEAVRWFKAAAEQKDPRAQLSLANCFRFGNGVDRNYLQALEWYKKAVQAVPEAYTVYDSIAEIYLSDDFSGKDYRQGIQWLHKSVELGSLYAKLMLGDCYLEGKGVGKDEKKAVELYHEAGTNYIPAIHRLARCYFDGQGVDQDYGTAMEWYKKARVIFEKEDHYRVGYCYANGLGVEVDYTQALYHYDRAYNHKKASHELGHVYFDYNWPGISHNLKKAWQNFKRAKEVGCPACAEFREECRQRGM